jgi:hypothetical protein
MMRHRRPTEAEMQKRRAELFAQMDANKDGRVTFEEFRQYQERRRLERQREMFQHFTGGQDSITLEQWNAQVAQRFDGRGSERGRGPGGQGPGPDQGSRPAR